MKVSRRSLLAAAAIAPVAVQAQAMGLGRGNLVFDAAVRQIGVTQQTFYRWRKLYGGMQRSQLKRLKELEKENQRLRRAVSDLTLDKLILTEAAKGNF